MHPKRSEPQQGRRLGSDFQSQYIFQFQPGAPLSVAVYLKGTVHLLRKSFINFHLEFINSRLTTIPIPNSLLKMFLDPRGGSWLLLAKTSRPHFCVLKSFLNKCLGKLKNLETLPKNRVYKNLNIKASTLPSSLLAEKNYRKNEAIVT